MYGDESTVVCFQVQNLYLYYLFTYLFCRQFHDDKSSEKTEDWHQSEGGFLKPIIFGGLDGILTSFAIVAGAAGGGLSPTVVLVLGFSNIFADALRYVLQRR
jgi:hypothetical protein